MGTVVRDCDGHAGGTRLGHLARVGRHGRVGRGAGVHKRVGFRRRGVVRWHGGRLRGRQGVGDAAAEPEKDEASVQEAPGEDPELTLATPKTPTASTRRRLWGRTRGAHRGCGWGASAQARPIDTGQPGTHGASGASADAGASVEAAAGPRVTARRGSGRPGDGEGACPTAARDPPPAGRSRPPFPVCARAAATAGASPGRPRARPPRPAGTGRGWAIRPGRRPPSPRSHSRGCRRGADHRGS